MTEHNDNMTVHEYDGIQEHDNNLPRWWLYLFYFSIIFAVVYMMYYHVLDIGYLQDDQYQAEVDPNFVRVSDADTKLLGVLPEYHSPWHNPRGDQTPRSRLMSSGEDVAPVMLTRATDTVAYIAVTDPAQLAAGKETFVRVCSQCHGRVGEGGVGPNLADDYWIHGDGINNVVKSIKYGYPQQGMVPWRGTLSPEEILNTASYVLTLRGTNPPNAKAPQGDLVTQ
jgi:cytochrome c oxidase cbb3-type subunit 3